MVRTDERRGAKGKRVPLEKVVDVCVGEAGGFQAKTLDISGRGMHLRTNLLPETSEPMVFRFHTPGGEVLAQGEVVWQSEVGAACDFGVRFTALDSRSAQNLTKLCGEAEPIEAGGLGSGSADRRDRTPTAWSQVAPSRATQGGGTSDGAVRLHVNGLSQPLRAEIREAAIGRLTVGSSLEFLSLGSAVEVEDAKNKARQKAKIGEVSVRVDPATQVPELLVSVTYSKQSTVRIGGTFFEELESGASDESQGSQARVLEDHMTGLPALETSEAPDDAASTRSSQREEGHENEEDGGIDWLEEVGSGVAEAAQWAARLGHQAQGRVTAVARWTAQRARANKGIFRPAGATGGARPRRTTSAAPSSLNRQRAARQGLRFDGRKRGPPESVGATRRLPRALVALGIVVAAGSAGTWVYGQLTTPRPAGTTVAVMNQRAGKAAATKAPLAASVRSKRPGSPSDVSGAKTQQVARASSDPAGVAPKTPPTSDGTPSTVFSRGRLHLPIKHQIRLSKPGQAVVGSSTLTGFDVTVPGTQALGNGDAIVQRDRRVAKIEVDNSGGDAKIRVRFHRQIPPYKVRVRDSFVEIFISAK